MCYRNLYNDAVLTVGQSVTDVRNFPMLSDFLALWIFIYEMMQGIRNIALQLK